MIRTAVTRTLGLVLGMFLCSCSGIQRQSEVSDSVRPGVAAVQQFGAMMPVMREGHTEARVKLAECATQHAIAVGAIEGLDGEITVIDGAAWVSRVRNGGIVTTGPEVVPTDRATLLTATRVDRWYATRLEASVSAMELEAAIERIARDHGLDTSRPLPFMIEGDATSLEMHVINGYCPQSSDEVAAGREPWRPTLTKPSRVVIVGFLAKNSEGIMTHHGTSIHAHGLLTVNGQRVTGHIDSIAIAAGAQIKVP